MIKFKKSFAKYKDPNGNMLDLGVLFGMGNWQAMGQVTMEAGKKATIVTHGLKYIPRNIVVTPHGNLGNVWVDNIYVESFTINCSSAPTSNIEISWRA